MVSWIVGRNRHTGEWSEGGPVDEYPPEHWEVFVVRAEDRDSARRAAQKERRRVKARTRRKGQDDETP